MPALRPGSVHRLWARLRVALAVLVLAALITGLGLLKIASSGIPRPVLDRLEDRLSTESVRVEIAEARATIAGTLSSSAIRLYRPGDFAPSAELTQVRGVFRWTWHGGPVPKLERIEVRNVSILSPELLNVPVGNESAGSGAASPAAPFPTISIACRHADVLGTAFHGVRIAISRDAEALRLDNISLDLAPGERVRGNAAMGADGTFRGGLSGTLDPSRLNPLLESLGSESLPAIFGDFEFPGGPPRADDFRFELDGRHRLVAVHVTAENLLYNDVPVLRALADIEVEGTGDEWTGVHVRNLDVFRPEGRADADLFFDFQRHGVDVDATSTLDFAHLSGLIGILSCIPWETYETAGGNRAEAHGYYGFSASEVPTDLRGSLSAGSFSFRRRVPVLDVTGTFRIDDEAYRFPDIRGRLYGGDCTAKATLRYDEADDLRVDFDLSVSNALARLVAQDIFHRETPDDPGRVDLRLAAEFNAETNTLRTATGTLSGRIRDARLYQTPLFAGFTDFMAHHVPGINFLVNEDDLDVEATIGDNGFHFSTLRVEGTLFSISGSGNYWFSDYLDLGVKVHLLRNSTWVGQVLKVVLYPVSKLFELEVTGPVANASWTPTTLSLSGRTPVTDEQKYGE